MRPLALASSCDRPIHIIDVKNVQIKMKNVENVKNVTKIKKRL